MSEMDDMMEVVARALYAQEKARSDHADMIFSAAKGKPIKFQMESFEEASGVFLSDARAAITAMLDKLKEPSEGMWGGLARDLIVWHDMGGKTPHALFSYLKAVGRPIPQWLRDEPEMRALNHVPSKGTRAALIWQAMLEQARKEMGL